jgi:hypothetical protein
MGPILDISGETTILIKKFSFPFLNKDTGLDVGDSSNSDGEEKINKKDDPSDDAEASQRHSRLLSN